MYRSSEIQWNQPSSAQRGSRYSSSGNPMNIGATAPSAGSSSAIQLPPATSSSIAAYGSGPGAGNAERESFRVLGSSNIVNARGRPRGRRPLRGQFPVVPIDMVRQLGIEQQVILQPPAPVAMRNKGVLSKPLYMSRKVQCQPHFADVAVGPDESHLNAVELDSATIADAKHENTSSSNEGRIQLLPIPIPVPIFIPFPMPMYTRPTPLPTPIPVPLPLPLPMLLEGPTEGEQLIKDIQATEVDGASIESLPSSMPADLESVMTSVQSSVASNLAGLADNPTSIESTKELNRKRAAVSLTPTETEGVVKRTRGEKAAVESESDIANQPISSSTKQPPVNKVEESYKLKYSYGANAWRHWIEQKNNRLIAEKKTPLQGDLLTISEAEMSEGLSMFVKEVRKPNDESYAIDSIYYLCLGIQIYLFENGRNIDIFNDSEFTGFTRVLGSILQNFNLNISNEGLLLCRIEEDHMWEAKQLGDHSPQVLLFTVLYFISKYSGTSVSSVHKALTFGQFEQLEDKVVLTLSNNKVCAFQLNTSVPNRCPVRLWKTYYKKCPRGSKSTDSPFYLKPKSPFNPKNEIWFSSTPESQEHINDLLRRINTVKEIQEIQSNDTSNASHY